jgi:hypothetical protein
MEMLARGGAKNYPNRLLCPPGRHPDPPAFATKRASTSRKFPVALANSARSPRTPDGSARSARSPAHASARSRLPLKMASRIGYPYSALDVTDLKAIGTKTKHAIIVVRKHLSDDPGGRVSVTAQIRRVAADILAHPGPSMKIRLAHAARLERIYEDEQKAKRRSE